MSPGARFKRALVALLLELARVYGLTLNLNRDSDDDMVKKRLCLMCLTCLMCVTCFMWLSDEKECCIMPGDVTCKSTQWIWSCGGNV